MVRVCRLESTKRISLMYIPAGLLAPDVLCVCACVCRHDMFGGVTAGVGSIHHVSQWTRWSITSRGFKWRENNHRHSVPEGGTACSYARTYTNTECAHRMHAFSFPVFTFGNNSWRLQQGELWSVDQNKTRKRGFYKQLTRRRQLKMHSILHNTHSNCYHVITGTPEVTINCYPVCTDQQTLNVAWNTLHLLAVWKAHQTLDLGVK